MRRRPALQLVRRDGAPGEVEAPREPSDRHASRVRVLKVMVIDDVNDRTDDGRTLLRDASQKRLQPADKRTAQWAAQRTTAQWAAQRTTAQSVAQWAAQWAAQRTTAQSVTQQTTTSPRCEPRAAPTCGQEDGSVGSSTDDGSTDDGSVGGSMNDGSMHSSMDGSTDHGSVGGSMDGSVGGSMDDGSMDDGSMDDGSMDDSSMDDGS